MALKTVQGSAASWPRVVLCALLALLAAGASQAAERGLYVNVKLGDTDADASFGDTFRQFIDGDEDSIAYELGFRFTRHWALQAAYHDFGDLPGSGAPCGGDAGACPAIVVPVEAETTAYSLSLLPQLPLGRRLSIFGKIGIVAWEGDIRRTDDAGELLRDFDEEDLLYGAGARLAIFGPFEIFYEYESVGGDLETQSFGLTFQF